MLESASPPPTQRRPDAMEALPMNPALLRSKRVALPAIAVVAVLATGATLRSATASDELRGSDRDRVARAAVEAVGGTVIEVEAGDDAGEAYEVEVRADDGTEVEVALDRELNVVSREVDDAEEAADETADDDGDDHADDDGEDHADNGDRALTASQRASAGKAALSAVGGGTVVEVEAGDEGTEAYEVEVRADGTEWEVRLDGGYRVLSKTADD